MGVTQWLSEGISKQVEVTILNVMQEDEQKSIRDKVKEEPNQSKRMPPYALRPRTPYIE